MTTGKQIVGWVIRIVAILVCVGAVGLCVVSAILSIMKLIKTYNTPASSYVQKTLTGFHAVPGLIKFKWFNDYDVIIKQSES